MIDFSIKSQGLANVINSAQDINLDWAQKTMRHDQSVSYENRYTRLTYQHDDGNIDKLAQTGEDEEIEKDVQELARIVAKERSRRELQPVLKSLQELSSIQPNGSAEIKEFIKQTKSMHELATIADTLLNQMANHKQNWLTKSILKIFK
jgi:uncharacterized membrane protein